ncbi:MAG: hypothetical protein EXS55_02540 [Candidatus Magasanikbacteria bacterium]|nr:hypothetical protein [Candidatus Magasanikbacteria bacterium]
MAAKDLNISEEQYATLCRHPVRVRLLANQLIAEDGGIVTRILRRGPGTIARLKAAGNYTGHCDPDVTDEAFQSKGEGKAPVRYRTLSGDDFKKGDVVYRLDVEAAFLKVGARFPDPDEALLPPAEDDTIGRDGKLYVAFIDGSQDAFIVGEYDDGQRVLKRHGGGGYFSSCNIYIGVVCE